MLQWYIISFFSHDHILITCLHQRLLNPWISGYKFVHAVAIQLINRLYSAVIEPAVRQAVSNTPCFLSYSVLRQEILTSNSCILTLWRLDDFSDIVPYIL